MVGFSGRWVSEVAGWMDEDMGMKDRVEREKVVKE